MSCELIRMIYGIDFGTTNSAIAYISQGKINVVPVDRNKRCLMRSALFFPNEENSVYVGDEAISRYLNYDMEGRLLQSIKTILPSATFQTTKIRGVDYTASDLVAEILIALKKLADTETGYNCKRVVISRPARFSDDNMKEQLAEERLREAAELAGFDDIYFQIEPVAAALSFEQSLTSPQLVLIADLGGGTSDFTLVELSPVKVNKRDRSDDITAINGLHVAGDVFDSCIMQNKIAHYFGEGLKYESLPGHWLPIPTTIFTDFCHKGRVIRLYNQSVRRQIRGILRKTDNPVPLRRLLHVLENNLGFSLFQSVEDAKCLLSEELSARINFRHKALEFDTTLMRSEFENMIKSPLDNIRRCISELVNNANVTFSEIDCVYLTGGTSQMPVIFNLFCEYIDPAKIYISRDTFLSVVKGLALTGKTFSSNHVLGEIA